MSIPTYHGVHGSTETERPARLTTYEVIHCVSNYPDYSFIIPDSYRARSPSFVVFLQSLLTQYEQIAKENF
ncbi:hypothetical protein SAMN06296273_1619 [Nitrosomonas ureae]|uniref:Uncharacterized protein n=1 Tax=Nitrosomonas ureae TaxID=44577 RepID=A0A285BZ65_9PROT|nr:hypothetical protein SAMN06296273_1619 [Nitrosomonas ureae]